MTPCRRRWAAGAFTCALALLCACAAKPPAPLRDAQRLEQQAQRQPGQGEQSLEALLRAHRIYQAADRGDLRGQTEVAIAALYLRRNELDAAQGWAARALAADVNAATQALAYARLTQIALRRGRPGDAAAAIDQAGQRCPACMRQAAFLILRGRVLLAQNRAAEALATAHQALAGGSYGDDPDRERADAQRLAGEAQLSLADYGAAQASLQSAFAADHAAARIERIWLDLDLLARADRGLGHEAEAQDCARRAALARAAAQAVP
jgi:tetratricopeptide (TPR) repeat protein